VCWSQRTVRYTKSSPVSFPSEDQRRLRELAEKQRQGNLSESDKAGMDRYVKVADFIEVLKAKAAASLSNNSNR
jgi:hypothetical protein